MVRDVVSFHPSFEEESDRLLYKEAVLLISLLKDAGFQAYFAGGAVRDMVLNRSLKDIDIATNASIDALKKLFPKAILVGAQFGVLRVILGKFEFEIATFRTESDYRDGRHPLHIERASSYEEDAQRRDFTINGLFFDPMQEALFDCVGGLADIEIKILRTIGSPKERFEEDRLRVLRAIRFSHSLDFPIQKETMEAMKDFSPSVPECVSGERIWDELSKLASLKILAPSFKTMLSIGLFQVLFPFITDEEVLIKRLSFLEKEKGSLLTALSLLFYDSGPFPLWAMEHFHMSYQELLFLEQFQKMWKEFSVGSLSELLVVDLLSFSYAEEILPSLAFLMPLGWLKEIQRKQKELAPWIEQRRTKRYSITGQMLLSRGVPPGKEVGLLMEKAFAFSLKKKILDKEILLQEVLHETL